MRRCICSRNQGGKKVICKKWDLSALSDIFGHFKSEFREKRYVVIFPITRRGRVEKSKKKMKKKNFLWDVFPCGFPISGYKKGGKSKWFCFFSGRGEGKCKINNKKKSCFLISGAFSLFLVVSLPEKMNWKLFGGMDKE